MADGRGKQNKQHGAGAARARERKRLEAAAASAPVPASVDACVIGGGAAGLAAAITAAEAGARVVVLERALECGRTILATGNGRCNFANVDLDPSNYNKPELAAHVMGEKDAALGSILSFFSASGLAWAEEDGRLYPVSRQAASVRNVLLARARAVGVVLAGGREVTRAGRGAGGWRVSGTQAWDGRPFELAADAVVLASGGATSDLARTLGLRVVDESPVLCGVAVQGPVPGMLERLSGRRAHALATLTRAGRVVHRETGEVLFRPYGISGIVSFNLSRHARPGDVVELDLAPTVDARTVDELVARRPGQPDALDGILDPQIASELIELAGGVHISGLAWRVAPLVKGLPLRVTGLADTEHAQVTRGGINVGQVDPNTLACAGAPGLFACGEALDVDGACGGYNLSWAWASGMRAGAGAARLAREAAEKRTKAEARRATEAEKTSEVQRGGASRHADANPGAAGASRDAGTATHAAASKHAPAPHSPKNHAREGKPS